MRSPATIHNTGSTLANGWLIALLILLLGLSASAATSPTNYTVRIPRNIRVSLNAGGIAYVAMETYTARSLNREWFSSWANYSGGSNSLKAGAVAVRSYAINKLNNVGTNSTYDICDTTSCQVYGSTSTTATDSAASQTTGYVVLSSSFSIPASEYSAENNSLGLSCGDGYTAPTGTCLYDPVCAGETRNGHGRGMCQWGSAKWATGLKIDGNGTGYPANADSGLTNGFPKQTWNWIINHYYPDYLLYQGKPLVDGDDVRASITIQVRMNVDGSISNAIGKGMTAPFITNKTANSVGVLMTNVGNGLLVTNDGFGFTWYKVLWSDGTIGWSPENWLQRVIPVPGAPSSLTATAISSYQINLAWSDTNTTEIGFEIQRSPLTNGNWSQLTTVATNVLSYSDTTVAPGTKYYYRVRAYNVGGNSSFSNTANTTTPAIPPTLAAISNRTVVEGTILTFTNSATAPDFETSLTDFETYNDGDAVMFRLPSFSGSTDEYMDSTTSADISAVTTSFPAGTNQDLHAYNVAWSFTNTSNPWLRLTTASTGNLPNPVIDFTKKLKFDIYTSKALRVAVGCRETTNASGTAIGLNGGTAGAIEWAGATNTLGAGPAPKRTVAANSWTNLSFDLPNEPVTAFTVAGNGVLSTSSGLGVLEHLAFAPAGGTGAYNVYLDNFVVATAKVLTYSLDPGAPTGASINPSTGVFTWTPTEAQGPGTYNITVRVTDNNSPAQSDAKTFRVTVNETNAAPALATITNYTIHAGNTLIFTNSATDSDIPANALSYSLTNGPAGATIVSSNGVFTWTPSDNQANTTNTIGVKVTDNGVPPLSNTKNFTVIVAPRPTLQSISANGGNFSFSWAAIQGKKYRIQFKVDLNDAQWTDLTDVTANSSTANFSEAAASTQRFYRIIDLD